MLSTEEFKRCAQEYMDMVFRVAFSCLRSQADAEDVTQEVLLRLYETDYVFESRAHIKNWLVKVTYKPITSAANFGGAYGADTKTSMTMRNSLRLKRRTVRICLRR